jgi:phenylacetate-CoA ligase
LKLFDRFLGKLAYVAWDTKEGGMRLEEWANLREQQYWSREQIRALQTQKLNKLVRHAYATSSWYRKVIDDIKLDLSQPITLADLSRFPITTKNHIRENTEAFISSQYPVESLRKAKTGGSTGVSLNLFFDARCQQLRNAAQIYADSFSGWEPGLRVAAVWGNPPIPKTAKQKVRAFLLDRMIYLDTMDLNPTSMGAFVKAWDEFEPEMIFGHSHSIYVFAKYLQDNGISHLRPRGIVGTSMMLLDHERALIESVFGCAVSNRYGCEEVGLIGVFSKASMAMTNQQQRAKQVNWSLLI